MKNVEAREAKNAILKELKDKADEWGLDFRREQPNNAFRVSFRSFYLKDPFDIVFVDIVGTGDVMIADLGYVEEDGMHRKTDVLKFDADTQKLIDKIAVMCIKAGILDPEFAPHGSRGDILGHELGVSESIIFNGKKVSTASVPEWKAKQEKDSRSELVKLKMHLMNIVVDKHVYSMLIPGIAVDDSDKFLWSLGPNDDASNWLEINVTSTKDSIVLRTRNCERWKTSEWNVIPVKNEQEFVTALRIQLAKKGWLLPKYIPKEFRGEILGNQLGISESKNSSGIDFDAVVKEFCKKFKMKSTSRQSTQWTITYELELPYPYERRSYKVWFHFIDKELHLEYNTYEHDPWDNSHTVMKDTIECRDMNDLKAKWLHKLVEWGIVGEAQAKKHRGEFLGYDLGIAEKLIEDINHDYLPKRGLIRRILLNLIPEICGTFNLSCSYHRNTNAYAEFDLFRNDKGVEDMKKTRLMINMNVYGNNDPDNNVVFSTADWSTGTSDGGPDKVICFDNFEQFEPLLIKYLIKAGTIDAIHPKIKKFRGQFLGQDLGIAENYFEKMDKKDSHKMPRLIDFSTFINESDEDDRKREMLFPFEKIVTISNFTDKFNLPRVQKFLNKTGMNFEVRKDENDKEYLYSKLPEHEMHRAYKNKTITTLRNAGFTGLYVYGWNIVKPSFQKDPDVV